MTTSDPNCGGGSGATSRVTFNLTGGMVAHFTKAWAGETRADLEENFDGFTRDALVTHIERLTQRLRVLDALAWGEATGDVDVSAPRDMVVQALDGMLAPGMSVISREQHAVASTAFAIEDQIEAAR